MIIRRLYVSGVRNLAPAELRFHGGLNTVIGPNGAGKTALLEAVYLAARGRSFRAKEIGDVVAMGREDLEVAGWFSGDQTGQIDLHVSLRRSASGSREIKVDGTAGATFAQVAQRIPMLVIGQDDARAMQHSSERRRAVLDSDLFHVKPDYADAWRGYRAALRQRNAALRRGIDARPWDAALVRYGEQLDAARDAHTQALREALPEAAERCGLGPGLGLVYRRGWPQAAALADALEAQRTRDREVGHTTAGPHRADLLLRLSGLRRSDQASGGQVKLMLLALRLAQLSHSRETRRIILLDDLEAELDTDHARHCLNALCAHATQVIATSPRPEGLVTGATAPRFHVEHGVVTPPATQH